MATTAAGTPYVESSDLVANYPGVSLSLANHIDGLDGGKVLQVVAFATNTQVISSTSTFVTTGLTATITPISASNKVLVMVMQSGLRKESTDTFLELRLMRGATEIFMIETFAGYTATTTQNVVAAGGANYLDAPATTSAVVYSTQFRSGANTANVRVQQGSSGSTIVLMEIAA